MGTGARKQPLYDQLVDVLTDKIENELELGDMLPSERELTIRYGVSRTTVRLALRELEDMGLVVRRHGKGTFVASNSRKPADLAGTYSLTEQMRSMGREPRSQVLEFEVREATKFLAAQMGVSLGQRVYRMRRLRLADDVPIMVERTYLPAAQFIGLTRERLSSKPLYDVVEQEYNQKIKVAEEAFSARAANVDEARLLEIGEGDPVLHLVRTTYNDKNEIIEYTRSVARADQFEYTIKHVRG